MTTVEMDCGSVEWGVDEGLVQGQMDHDLTTTAVVVRCWRPNTLTGYISAYTEEVKLKLPGHSNQNLLPYILKLPLPLGLPPGQNFGEDLM